MNYGKTVEVLSSNMEKVTHEQIKDCEGMNKGLWMNMNTNK